MNYAAHLSNLIAIIVGLAVTELLAGASRTLKRQKEPGFSWLPFVQAIMIGTIILIFWIASYAELSSGKYLGTFAYTTQLVAPGLLYFATTRVFPSADGDAGLTVQRHAVANARDVNFPAALWMLCTIGGNLFYFWPNWGGTLGPNLLCAASIATLLVAALARNDRVRWAATILTEVIVLGFIVIYLGNSAPSGA
jgi:hypothetical protein